MASETSSSKIIHQASWSPPGSDIITHVSRHANMDEIQRRYRRDAAWSIDRCYTFGSVRQHIVRPSGCDTLQDEKYYGVSLVGVYGMNSSICVVTKPNELDMTQLQPNLRSRCFIGRIVEAFISKLEGLAFGGDRETKPFGFVSVDPLRVSSSEYDERRAIDYLTRKMQRGLKCNFDETIMTAICAFKHLCLNELKAEQLLVTSWSPKVHGSVSQRLLFREIQNYLDIIYHGSIQVGSDLRDYLYRLDSHIDSVVKDSNLDMQKLDVEVVEDVEDMDLDCCPIDHQEREKCQVVVFERMPECAKSKGLIYRRALSIEFQIGGYAFKNVRKTCMSCCGILSYKEVSYGLTWVAVHGKKSICMVVRRNDVDMKRVGHMFTGIPKYGYMSQLAGAVISDIEDFPDGESIKVPFGVVSENMGMNKVHEKRNCNEAITFIEEKIRYGSMFDDVDETIRIAIFAFQLLCFEELKVEDIYVSSGEVGSLMPLSLTKGEIRRHLQGINRSLSSFSPPPPHPPAV